MKIRLKNFFILKPYLILFILTIVGYAIVGIIPGLFKIENPRFLTISFRLLVLFLSIYILIGYQESKIFKLPFQLINLFWILFVIRLIIDIIIKGIVKENGIEYFLYAIGICYIPMIALTKMPVTFNFEKTLKYIVVFLFISSFIGVYYHITILSTWERKASSILSGIQFGHIGASLSILSLFIFFDKGKSFDYFKKISTLALFLLGLYVINLSGTRSALIALVIVSLLIFYIMWKPYLKERIFIIKKYSLIFFPIIIIGIIFIDIPKVYSFISERIHDISSINLRLELYKEAINQFLSYPIFGSDFILFHEKGSYPHNIFLEVLMSMGLIGITIFTIIIIYSFRSVYFNIKFDLSSSWISLLFIQYFIKAFFSLPFYRNEEFWILLALVLVQYFRFKQNLYRV